RGWRSSSRARANSPTPKMPAPGCAPRSHGRRTWRKKGSPKRGRPSALRGDRLPSVTQLPELVDGFRRDTGTTVSLVIEGPPRPLPAEADRALYRGAQEALTNIARYAPGATAAVTVRYQPGHTTLTVQNGACPRSGGPAATARDGGPLAGGGGGGAAAAAPPPPPRGGAPPPPPRP